MRVTGLVLALAVLTGVALAMAQQNNVPEPEVGLTPPRLSMVDGQASFWRQGAQDWSQAQVNTPLAPGDQLYTGSAGALELQIGSRAFVRARENTQLGLENEDSDFLQFKVTSGNAVLDLRTLDPGHRVEVDTPNAAFAIEHAGYYRVTVDDTRTSLITRRAGQAVVIPAGGEAFVITPSEEVVIEGITSPQVVSYVAPPLDQWDKWNYTRTDRLIEAVSARYVSRGVYGLDDLDAYGRWRVVPTYGSVWVPARVPAGWAPYSMGSWVSDPFYGWTWVDTEPWGWAPYHYGRWVFVDGFWAWAPGPVVVRPAYSPALVAFFGGPDVGVSIGISMPVVGWVALGWGEPCVPWWGPSGFRHRPWWGGWGGPRIVNNVVINRTTIVNVQEIKVYRNATVRNAVMTVKEDRFGRGLIRQSEFVRLDPRRLQPMHTAPQVSTTALSFAPRASRGIQPPAKILERSVVATRQPHLMTQPSAGRESHVGPPGVSPTPPRIVSVPQGREPVPSLQRPPLGQSKIERSTIGRAQMPPPPRLGAQKRSERAPEGPPPAVRQAPPKPEPHVEKPAPSQQRPPLGQSKIERGATGRAQPPPSAGLGGQKPPERASEGPPPAIRQAPPKPKPPAEMNQPRVVRPKTPTPLPGEPANRLAPNRAQARPQAPVEQQTPRMEKKAPAVAPKPQPVRPHGSPGIEPKEGPESRK